MTSSAAQHAAAGLADGISVAAASCRREVPETAQWTMA